MLKYNDDSVDILNCNDKQKIKLIYLTLFFYLYNQTGTEIPRKIGTYLPD